MGLELINGEVITVLCTDIENAYTDLVYGVDNISVMKVQSADSVDKVVSFCKFVKEHNLQAVVFIELDKGGNIKPEFKSAYDISDLIMVYMNRAYTIHCIKDSHMILNRVCKNISESFTVSNFSVISNNINTFVSNQLLKEYTFIPTEVYVLKVPHQLISAVTTTLKELNVHFCELLYMDRINFHNHMRNTVVITTASAILTGTDNMIVCSIGMFDGNITISELVKHGVHNRSLSNDFINESVNVTAPKYDGYLMQYHFYNDKTYVLRVDRELLVAIYTDVRQVADTTVLYTSLDRGSDVSVIRNTVSIIPNDCNLVTEIEDIIVMDAWFRDCASMIRQI